MAAVIRTALTGRTHGCTDQPLRREDSPCQLEAVHTWHYSDLVPCRLEFRLRRDSVAKLGKRRLTRNNRIGAKDLLNRCCALVAVLESMLPARAPKIVLQQNRAQFGRDMLNQSSS